MPILAAAPLAVNDEQRAGLERIARSTSLPYRKVIQPLGLLVAGDGVNQRARTATTNRSVRVWRRRLEVEAVEGAGRIAPGRNRKSWLPKGTLAEVVLIAPEERPDDGATHWTNRTPGGARRDR